MSKSDMRNQHCTLDREKLLSFLRDYRIPPHFEPSLPSADSTMDQLPEGKIGLYMASFEIGNTRLPFTNFYLDVLNYFKCHVSQMHPFGSARISSFEIACAGAGGRATVTLFRRFYKLGRVGDWFTIERRTEDDSGECLLKVPDSKKLWKGRFFWVSRSVVRPEFPNALRWRVHVKGGLSDPFPQSGFNVGLHDRLIRNPIAYRVFPEPILYLAGVSPIWAHHPLRPLIYVDGQGTDTLFNLDLFPPFYYVNYVRMVLICLFCFSEMSFMRYIRGNFPDASFVPNIPPQVNANEVEFQDLDLENMFQDPQEPPQPENPPPDRTEIASEAATSSAHPVNAAQENIEARAVIDEETPGTSLKRKKTIETKVIKQRY